MKRSAPLRLLRRFRDDVRGVAAVEFALILPVMVVFYFGVVELCQGLMAQKRAEQVSSAIADLVAQDDRITTTEMNDIFTVATHILRPFPAATLRQRVTSVTRNAQGQNRVDWSSVSNWTARAANSTMTLPANLLANGESIVVSEVEYTYTSVFDHIVPATMTFRKTSYLRPRKSDKVERS